MREEDLADLLRLLRAYCRSYGAAPADDDLLALSRALLADGLDVDLSALIRLYEERHVDRAGLTA